MFYVIDITGAVYVNRRSIVSYYKLDGGNNKLFFPRNVINL